MKEFQPGLGFELWRRLFDISGTESSGDLSWATGVGSGDFRECGIASYMTGCRD